MESPANSSCPTTHVEDFVYVAILKAADSLSQEAEQIIKSAGLTAAQYNVLRILRGAQPDGLFVPRHQRTIDFPRSRHYPAS